MEIAVNQYIEASVQARTRGERMSARRRLEQAQIRLEMPQYRVLHPALTLARLGIGPALLYFTLFLVQSGFNIYRASRLLLFSNLSVLLGGFLLVFTSATPVVHTWYLWWQRVDGESEELARKSLWFLAFLFILAPFVFLFVEGIIRA
jgi:hypothetical protein